MEQDNVNHPAHYEQGFETRTVECIDITRHLPFALGNAVKYVWRAGKKGDLAKAMEDLDKAQWYADEWASVCGNPTERPHWLTTARAVFNLVIYPQGGGPEAYRYTAIDLLLGYEFDLWEIKEHIDDLREALKKEMAE